MIVRVKKIYIAVPFLIAVLIMISVFTLNNISVDNSLNGKELPIVMYHQLTESESKAGKYVLTVDEFERDLKFLKVKGYETVTVNQVIDYSQGKGDLPDKPVMLTFDDGCETLSAYALPLLEKYGFNAVGFVVGSFTEKFTQLNDHNLNYSYLTWSQLKELSDSGIIDIQSHSYDLHNNTSERSGAKKKKNESFEQYSEFLSEDASIMKERLMQYTGKAPVAFAYPFGSYSEESPEILKKCGIKMVLTCEERVNIIKKAEPERLFRLGRYNRPYGISSESFFEKMGIG